MVHDAGGRMGSRGLALILVAGVLGILAVLAAAFVTMARLERKASLQRLHATRAQLLARSGLEDAVARLAAGQDPSLASTRYGGEDYDGNGSFSLVEPANEVVGPTVLNVETCPAKYALRPSFFRRDTFGVLPDLVWVEGRKRGYTGQLKGDAVSGGNVYALKVEDESGKINVNGGFLDGQNRDGDGALDFRDVFVASVPLGIFPPEGDAIGRGWNGQLARILNVLGQQPAVGIPGLGTLVLRNRPLGGYRSIAALQTAIGYPTNDLSPWLTVSSWIDRGVVHPNGYTTEMPSILADCKRDRAPLILEEGGRPPVNLNAATSEILVSLLQDLQGTGFLDSHATVGVYEIPSAMAAGIAAQLLARRPFASWQRFAEFCDGLVPGVINGMTMYNYTTEGVNLAGADLLKANFNPNTQLAKELPDQLMWKWVDKSDLTVWSTEGSLGPTGTFKVGAVGRVLGKGGVLLAERSASATVEAFSLLRQTSQQDFVGERSPVTAYLSLASPSSPGGNIPTTGTSASWNPAGGGRGLAVVTYPCAPTALPGKAAAFDGSLGLATVELNPAFNTPGAMTFLQHFDDGWDADPPSVDPTFQSGISGSLQKDLSGTDTWPGYLVEPSAFYPDGVHAQLSRAPAYRAPGNFPPGSPPSNRGAISYWVKPAASIAQTYIDISCVAGTGAQENTQALGIGHGWTWAGGSSGSGGGDCWGIIMENRPAADAGSERQSHVEYGPVPGNIKQVLLPGLRWHLVTAFFDTASAVTDADVNLNVRSVTGSENGTEFSQYPTTYATACSDLFVTGVTFALGGWTLGEVTLQRANQVIDEFAICDIQGGAITPATWALERYSDGRYYKGGDGRFLSVPLQPQTGVPLRLLRAAWTEYLPRETRKELLGTVPQYGPVPAPVRSRLVDPILADAPSGKPRAWIELELLDAAGTLTGSPLQPLSQGGAIGRTLAGFCYRVTFRTDLANPLDEPVLETPFLDDVTFFWQPATGPRVLTWSDAP